MAFANISIASNRSRKGADGQWADEVSFFDLTLWGKQAETLKQYLVKGKQIAAVGHLKQDSWEKDGRKQSRVSIVAESVELLGGNGGGQSHQQNFRPNPQAAQPDYNGMGPGGEFPEDIPF
jgi:single-strand DNA-binding protein